VRVADKNILATPLQLKLWSRKQSPQGMVIKYGENEKMLLSYLSAHPSITLGMFCRMATIPRYKAENILVNLIYAGLVELVQEDQAIRFRLREIPTDTDQ